MVLHCDVDSNPVPTITWSFGEKVLTSVIASNASLFLENLTPEDQGLYTCSGDNGYGIMNTTMFLAVNCEYKFVVRRARVSVT